nr:hypothetical protein [uncultured Brumimicrobium sp.]
MKYVKIIWLLITVVALLVIVTPLEYTYDISFPTINLIVLITFITLVLTMKKSIHWIYTVVFGLFIVCVPINFLAETFSFGSGFKTQAILYRQIGYPNNRIEYVWEDLGAFGYNKTYQKVIPITPLFEWRINTDPSNLDKSSWKKVNENVNELGLKGG